MSTPQTSTTDPISLSSQNTSVASSTFSQESVTQSNQTSVTTTVSPSSTGVDQSTEPYSTPTQPGASSDTSPTVMSTDTTSTTNPYASSSTPWKSGATNANSSTTQLTSLPDLTSADTTTNSTPANNATNLTYPTSTPLPVTSTVPETTTYRAHCADPLPILGGTILSTGPYFANVSSAVFSCFGGYKLHGPQKIACGVNGTWQANPPYCVPDVNNPRVDNHISLGDDTKVPLWLTIVLCIAFGLVCLLLLACVVWYCLKIFGCWKGPRFGPKVNALEEGTMSNGYRSTGLITYREPAYRSPRSPDAHAQWQDRDIRDRNNKYDTNERNGNARYTQDANPERQHAGNGRYGNKHFYNWEQGEDPVGGSVGKLYRREAKMPAKQTWMPHSRNFRNINTSTK